MKSNRKINFNLYLFIFISIIWISVEIFFIFSDFKSNYKNYRLISPLSLDDKRAVTTGWDFYQFLMFCDRVIPKGKDIKWIFPEGGFLGNSEYHFFKAYYYLYPRNYRDNADYIIVYNRENYNMPSGYKIFAEYGKNKYILVTF